MNRRWLLWLLFASVVPGAIGWLGHAGLAQKDHRADRRLAVEALDQAWLSCRSASGRPVMDEKGCRWLALDGGTGWKQTFTSGKGWSACPWKAEANEEATEDESACGIGWREGFDHLTQEGATK